jgi:hypothetical protein
MHFEGIHFVGAYANVEVTLHLPHGPILLDTSMIYPHCSTSMASASLPRGAAAALRDLNKLWAHVGHLHPCHTFAHAGVDTYGHPTKPIMQCLHTRCGIDKISGCHPGVFACKDLG